MTPWLVTEHMLVTPWLTVAALLAGSGYLARVAWRLWPRKARPMSAAARDLLARPGAVATMLGQPIGMDDLSRISKDGP